MSLTVIFREEEGEGESRWRLDWSHADGLWVFLTLICPPHQSPPQELECPQGGSGPLLSWGRGGQSLLSCPRERDGEGGWISLSFFVSSSSWLLVKAPLAWWGPTETFLSEPSQESARVRSMTWPPPASNGNSSASTPSTSASSLRGELRLPHQPVMNL